MLEELLTELHNWFRVRDSVDGKHPGTYTVEGGRIVLPFLQRGQYFRIIGSVLGNDGLYIYGETITDENQNEIWLTDETFTGSIWALAIPKVIIHLSREKAENDAKIVEVTRNFADSGFTSENLAGAYSYTKDQSGQLSALTAQREDIIRRMNKWRKIRED